MEINSDKLREVRRHLDMTQAEFAEHLGVSQRTIVNWENSGVPESKSERVAKLLRPALDEMEMIEDMRSRPDREPPPGWVERRNAELETHWIPGGLKVAPPSPDERRSRLLAPFTNIDLLEELVSRSKSSGSRAGLWNAERVEQYQRYISPEWHEDPDYSDMSEEEAYELGLAAKREDEHIGDDDMPNEP